MRTGDRTNIAFLWVSYCTYKNPERVFNKRIIIIIFPLQSVQIFDVGHVINRKMMKSVRR